MAIRPASALGRGDAWVCDIEVEITLPDGPPSNPRSER
jgi:hypothetical protein